MPQDVGGERKQSLSTIIIRFPDGTREYRYTGRSVEQGDVIWHDGEQWTVLAVVSNDGGPQTATVELNSDGLIDKLQSEKGAVELGPLHDLVA
jgi:hypothetical protein